MKIFEKIKEKLPHGFKMKKKTIIIVSVAVVAVAVFAFSKLRNKQDMPTFVPEIRTLALEKTSLVNSVGVTGTVKSVDVVNVTTTLPYKVKEILVQVGDKVNKGDIIAKLDSQDLDKEIAEERKRLNETRESTKETLDKATIKKDTAYDDALKAEGEWRNAVSAKENAYTPYKNAKNSIAVQQNEYNAALKEQERLGNIMNAAYAALEQANNAKAAADSAKTAADTAVTDTKKIYDDSVTASESAEIQATKKAAWDKAVADQTAAAAMVANATTAVTNAQTVYDGTAGTGGAKKDYDDYANPTTGLTKAAFDLLETAKQASNFTGYETSYVNAEAAVKTKRLEYDAKLASYDASLESYKAARKAYEDADTSKTLEELTKKLKECTITAETNGVITVINAVVGSAMGQSANAGTGPLAVIQDTDNLVIQTSFKEYDIPKISIGQKVTITSDATEGTTITGYVSQISMTGENQNGSEVSFPAEIKIDTANSGLLIGMNAKANVILNEKNNIFVVPDDAIGTNENGQSVVYVQNGENYDPIVVETGVSNDFDTEIISGQLKEGMIIRASADPAGANMVGGVGGSMGGSTGGNIIMGGSGTVVIG